MTNALPTGKNSGLSLSMVSDYGSNIYPTYPAPAKIHLRAMDCGLWIVLYDLSGNQLGSAKNLWIRREYGLRGLWIRRESTVLYVWKQSDTHV